MIELEGSPAVDDILGRESKGRRTGSQILEALDVSLDGALDFGADA
jgi:hypothetical protein